MRLTLFFVILCLTLICPRVKGDVYVTERNVSIDRCGTAWFITRFVDANAEFQFFATGDVPPPGISYGFFGSKFFNKGPDCTFTVMLKAYQKADLKPLQRMSEQINDVFAWRAGPESIARYMRDGIGNLRSATDNDLTTYNQLFLFFDFLYLAYEGDPSKFLPSKQNDLKHLNLRILLDLAENQFSGNIPKFPSTTTDEDFEKSIASIYQKLSIEEPTLSPFGTDQLSSWINQQKLNAPNKQALQKLYQLIQNRIIHPQK